MKAILEFNLDELDDRANHWYAINSNKAFIVLRAIEEKLRNDWKYNSDLSEEIFPYIEKLREFIRQEMQEYNIRHDEYSI